MKTKLRTVFIGIVCSLLICSSVSLAQIPLKLSFSIDTAATAVKVDNFDNIYVSSSQNQLLKYGPSGKLLWNYSNKAFGKLGYVDVTDPMRILLFYPALQQVVILNNNLNEITRFNFGTDASRFVTLVSATNANGYWVYDQQNRTLQKLGNQFNEEQTFGNVFQQTGLAIQPAFMFSTDQSLFLYDPKEGILVFDRFGTYSKTVKLGQINGFQVKDDAIQFLQENNLIAFNLSTNDRTLLFKFPGKVLSVHRGSKVLATLTEKGILAYEILPAAVGIK